jgi:DnaK suppressor protein
MASKRSPLTKEQLETLRRKLEDERRRILTVLQAPTAVVPSEDERTELEESAQRVTERTRQLGVAERERALLAEVEEALARLRAGTYGISAKSGDPIPFERLAAVPWAREGIDE